MKLSRKFYSRNTKIVAKELLGKILVHKKCKGKIVETEAYFGKNDPASHAYGKKTKRNILMYQKPGTAYVYFTYGNHWMFNVVTEKTGIPGAVLIRALEPLEGIEIMKKRRKLKDILKLCRGPGRLTKAFKIDGKFNDIDIVTSKKLFIEKGRTKQKFKIISTHRVGVSDKSKLRFYIKNNRFISRLDVK